MKMAERRMFAKTIIDSDAFLDMPLSSQALYFHLSMRADDDGFINNPKKIQRMIGCTDDDLRILLAKRFIIPFESGIVVIKHWRINNYIRNDRYKPTLYRDEMEQLTVKENGSYTVDDSALVYQTDTEGIPMVPEWDTQVRLGKDRLDKDRLGKDRLDNVCTEPLQVSMPAAVPEPVPDVPPIPLNDGSEWRPNVEDIEEWQRLYNGVDVIRELARMRQWSLSNPTKRKTKKGIRRFVQTWLDREQNSASRNASAKQDRLSQSFEMIDGWASNG